VPHSPDADRALEEARDALAVDALDRARDATWRAASAAAQIGDEQALEEAVAIASELVERKLPDADRLRVYAEACLEDARNDTRPKSWFERLMKRDLRR
jgi:hypothetical protein